MLMRLHVPALLDVQHAGQGSGTAARSLWLLSPWAAVLVLNHCALLFKPQAVAGV